MLYPVQNTQTRHVIKHLNEIIQIFGVPKRIITDQGTAFTAESFQNFCSTRNIRCHVVAVGMPRANGQVERYNRTVLDALGTMGANIDDTDWDINVPAIQSALNNSYVQSSNWNVPI